MAKGINIMDILPTEKVKIPSTQEIKEITAKYEKFSVDTKRFVKQFNSLFREDYLTEGSQTAIKIASNRIMESEEMQSLKSKREWIFKTYGAIPSELYNSIKVTPTKDWRGRVVGLHSTENEDITSKISEIKVVKGGDILDLVNKFNFVFIPFNCLDERSYQFESSQIKSQISRFNEEMSEIYDVYAVCPLSYYSVAKHVANNKTNLPTYFGNHSTSLLSLSLSIPYWQSVEFRLDSLEKRVDDLEEGQRKIIQAINQTQEVLLRMQRESSKSLLNTIVTKLETKGNKVEIKTENIKEWIPEDPILIAVPKGVDVDSESFEKTKCKVGVCWGPDFTHEVAVALDLKIIRGQKKNLLEINNKIWN